MESAEGLPAEGYVVAVGEREIVLDGVDTDGTFYVAQTLAQLVQGNHLDGVEIRDWPAMRYRGSIEGFNGTPWSHADRLDHLDCRRRDLRRAAHPGDREDPGQDRSGEGGALCVRHPKPGILQLAGPDEAQKWKAAPLELKRAVIRALTVVTILPIGSGAKPTPESIHIQWRTADGRLIDAA
ncbi:glycosyl hydrolase family 20 [Kribbella steppae]|uniref:Glycosyl hydrolase family 20 n=1 Tax=Kribbella steppae TaxID=2512223 RepID=A0A4R2HQD6_9ACTN|nr:glycoside hydrolase family 20 zincin-like fold domain-containing protein [Kribbella steppae]TCO33392.1 glycosyl hydrolase family 20 [Kribbella steppae]